MNQQLARKGELVVGWHRIGVYLDGVSADAARRLGREAGLPVFHISPKKVASTTTYLDAWVVERAAAAKNVAARRVPVIEDPSEQAAQPVRVLPGRAETPREGTPREPSSSEPKI